MILTLEVVGEQAAQFGAGRRKVFHSTGGTIGRLPDNDWVFPDPYVSGRHALIRYLGSNFFVEDTSTNGVFVNTPEFRVSKTQAYQLKNGDVLFIDAYEIAVRIEKEAAANAQERDPLMALQSLGRRQERRDDSDRGAPAANRKPAAQSAHQAAQAAPPAGEELRTVIMPMHRHDADVADRNSETQWFGLGEMSLRDPSAPMAQQVSADPQETSAAALPDVADERAAVLAAMRLAFETMLAKFDPDRLQEEFDRHMKKGSILGAPAKLRYWDLYREKYGDMAKDAESSFQMLFGNEFAKAYEEQMERLKMRGRNR